MYPPATGLPSLNTLASDDKPSIHDMLHPVHGHRSLHHGTKKTYLALCTRYPGHGIPMRIVQDFVAECSLCQKDRITQRSIPHPTSLQTILHHKRSIGIDHITITPPDEDGYIGLLLVVELGGLSPAELKFGTTDYHRFHLPLLLVPGHNYGDLVQQLDQNLATVRTISATHQNFLHNIRRKSATSQNISQAT